jgi:hypothetical protein
MSVAQTPNEIEAIKVLKKDGEGSLSASMT